MVTDQMLDLFNVDMYKKNNEVEEEGKSNAEDSEKSKKMESLLILILTKAEKDNVKTLNVSTSITNSFFFY